MKRVIVRYKLKPGKADENAEYIRKVFEELKQSSPPGFRYASFKLADGLTFVHIASIETDDGSNPLSAASAFKKFTAELKDRCDEPPVASEVETIGSYRLLDA